MTEAMPAGGWRLLFFRGGGLFALCEIYFTLILNRSIYLAPVRVYEYILQ